MPSLLRCGNMGPPVWQYAVGDVCKTRWQAFENLCVCPANMLLTKISGCHPNRLWQGLGCVNKCKILMHADGNTLMKVAALEPLFKGLYQLNAGSETSSSTCAHVLPCLLRLANHEQGCRPCHCQAELAAQAGLVGDEGHNCCTTCAAHTGGCTTFH